MRGLGQAVDDFLRRRPIVGGRSQASGMPGTPAPPSPDPPSFQLHIAEPSLQLHIAAPDTLLVESEGGPASETFPSFSLQQTGGGDAWTNLDNAEYEDANNAQCSVAAESSSKLVSNTIRVPFRVPQAAILVGITATIRMSTAVGGTTNASLRLQKGDGTFLGTAKVQASADAQTTYNLGGAADLWGSALTADDVNRDGLKISVAFLNTGFDGTIIYLEFLKLTSHWSYAVGG